MTSLLASCGTEPASYSLRCDEGYAEIARAFQERWDPPSRCTADSECVLSNPTMQCPDDGALYTGCPRAVHEGDVDALQSAVDDALAEVCPQIPPDCRGGASCVPLVARCEEGRCVGVPESAAAPDAG